MLAKIIDTKSKDIPLLTLSNHHSCFDDPGIWGKSCDGNDGVLKCSVPDYFMKNSNLPTYSFNSNIFFFKWGFQVYYQYDTIAIIAQFDGH